MHIESNLIFFEQSTSNEYVMRRPCPSMCFSSKTTEQISMKFGIWMPTQQVAQRIPVWPITVLCNPYFTQSSNQTLIFLKFLTLCSAICSMTSIQKWIYSYNKWTPRSVRHSESQRIFLFLIPFNFFLNWLNHFLATNEISCLETCVLPSMSIMLDGIC